MTNYTPAVVRYRWGKAIVFVACFSVVYNFGATESVMIY